MSNKTKSIVLIILFCSIIVAQVSGANVTDDRQFFEETTAIPFETWVLLFGAGMLFLILAAFMGVIGTGGLTLIFGIISTLFLSASAYATPVTGFYSYVSNSTTNATSMATPVVWGAFQPWMAWMMWGLASIAFIIFVSGVLILFKEMREQKEHDENMDWI